MQTMRGFNWRLQQWAHTTPSQTSHRVHSLTLTNTAWPATHKLFFSPSTLNSSSEWSSGWMRTIKSSESPRGPLKTACCFSHLTYPELSVEPHIIRKISPSCGPGTSFHLFYCSFSLFKSAQCLTAVFITLDSAFRSQSSHDYSTLTVSFVFYFSEVWREAQMMLYFRVIQFNVYY